MTSVISYLWNRNPTKEETNDTSNNQTRGQVNAQSNSTSTTGLVRQSSSNANANSNSNSHSNGRYSLDALEANESTSLLPTGGGATVPQTIRRELPPISTDDSFKTARDFPEMLSPLNDEDDNGDLSNNHHQQQQHDKNPKILNRPPTVNEFYFSPNNPTVQRYYRFTSSALTPIAALHRRPSSTPRTSTSSTTTGSASAPRNNENNSGVTGLLRRSAVVPSHGTDASGHWILVSVGGRSGWARKKSHDQPYAGFTPAPTFQATEGWMGNHAFLCHGKLMLGSDAPSLFFTNGLLLLGALMHFGIILPA